MTLSFYETRSKSSLGLKEFSSSDYSQKFSKAFEKCDFISRIIASISLSVLALSILTGSFPSSILINQTPLSLQTALDKKGIEANVIPSSEWFVAAYGGAPYTYPSDVRVTELETKDFTVKNVEWRGLPFINPIYYGARIVRWFSNARIGGMLDFTHSKAISVKDQKVLFQNNLQAETSSREVLIKDIFHRLEASHGHNMLTMNGMLRLPSLSQVVSPYVGLGVGVSLPHAEVHLTEDSSRTYEYQLAGPVGQALIGFEIRLPVFSYFIEYKFTFADYRMPLSGQDGYILFTDLWRQFKRWYEKKQPIDGWVETNFSSHQVIGGLGVRLKSAYAN
ncbi:MAG: hypothetical protein ACKOW3_03310 [Hyphomicrobium sp.]